MARTVLFRRVRRALIEARLQSGAPSFPRALNRRQALLLGAAALAACATRGSAPRGPVAIIGGGAAGLTAAYRLALAGIETTVFDAASRFGGRMFTRDSFTQDGQFCELGGELVDSNHQHLIALAGELGVSIQRIAPEGETDADLYDIGGRLRRASDMYDPSTGRGPFAAIARKIADDQAKLLDEDEEWTAYARALDAMSLSEYLGALRSVTDGWAVDFLDLAYLAEYGRPTAEQSALNLVDFIGVDPQRPFEVFGDSDEAHRIAGGSSRLIDALLTAIEGRTQMAPRHALRRLRIDGGELVLTFDSPQGKVEHRTSRAVLALPFTLLREVEGVDSIGLTAHKKTAIAGLGYGNNAKLMVATKTRPWTGGGASAFAGALYSDRGAQVVWETSRGQPGKGGVLTNFMAGPRSDLSESELLESLGRNLAALSPGFGAALDRGRVASFFWNRYPLTKGSYASPAPGQYTTLLEVSATPELGGRLHFAGEHTSADFMGFMNGAVESGERVAAEILGA